MNENPHEAPKAKGRLALQIAHEPRQNIQSHGLGMMLLLGVALMGVVGYAL